MYSGFLRKFHANLHLIIDLKAISTCKGELEFNALLDSYTSKLKQKVAKPVNAEHWGICRKAINLYLRDCYYNKALNEHFSLDKVASYLETPIDSFAMKALAKYTSFVKKSAIKALDKNTHQEWQKAAKTFAQANKLPNRVDADLKIYKLK
jgi:hypothetical protein